MKIKSYIRLFFVSTLVGGILMSLSLTPVTAQSWYSPNTYGTSLLNYGYLGGVNPFLGYLGGGNYYGSLFSPISSYNPYYFIMQINQIYNYLDYSLRFYEIARQTPFFYIYDQTADYIGANLYNYASNLGISPQESIIYFIQENFFSPQA